MTGGRRRGRIDFMVTNRKIEEVIRAVRRETRRWRRPSVTAIAKRSRDPYRVLIGCLLSLRTKDETTAPAAARLFALARTPSAMARLPASVIAKSIYPVGCYRKKEIQVREISKALLE